MLRYLADYSLTHWSVLKMFDSTTFCGLLALLLAFAFAMFFLPRLIKFLMKRRALENMSKESALIESQHAAKIGTVTMGGAGIAAALLVSVLLVAQIENIWVWGAILIFVGNAAIGFLDDLIKLKRWRKHGMNKRQKTAGLLLFAMATAWLVHSAAGEVTTKILLPFMAADDALDLGWWYYPYFVFVIYACANAVNLTDGLDGLASGCAISSTLAFAVFGYVAGNVVLCGHFSVPYIRGAGELCIIALALVGAVAGFLWFNAHPAKIFMGDTGSLAIGGLIGYIALVCKQEIPLVIASGIFVLEALSVIIQIISFRGWKRRVFLCAPLHHHFELSGWNENHIVVRFWMVSALFSAAAIGTLKMH